MKPPLSDDVTCHLRERYGSCKELPFHREHKGRPYCVLHLPSEDKEAAFLEALDKKLGNEDFNFQGAFFPSYTGGRFLRYEFGEEVNFMDAVFCGFATFHGATFRAGAAFIGTTFKGQAFLGATYEAATNFLEATFHDLASFSGATFKDDVICRETTFEGRVIFLGALFHKEADFSGTTFNQDAEFSYAMFKQEANFAANIFESRVLFHETTFEGKVGFFGATFRTSAFFWSLKTLPQTAFDFRNVRAEKPEEITFHTTHLRPSSFIDVDAQKFDFSDVEWFTLPNGNKLRLEDEVRALEGWGQDPPQSLRKLTKACRRLMNNAEGNRDYPLANEFHYWSMEAIRKEGLSRLGLIAALYWALSGYGERPRRAFAVLVGMWLAFAALYLLVADTAPFWVFSASDVWQGIDYARQAVVYSLTALARLNPEPQPEELGWFQTLVTLEGLLGPLQFALFLLAVRRKVMR
jgi:uncharacterized protein YjbI with pentapeptide repeats